MSGGRSGGPLGRLDVVSDYKGAVYSCPDRFGLDTSPPSHIHHPQLTLDDPDDSTCMTFVLHDEDHTLGNALRYMIMKKYVRSLSRDWSCTRPLTLPNSPDVTFCGYSVPHPSESKINLRIQTSGEHEVASQ